MGILDQLTQSPSQPPQSILDGCSPCPRCDGLHLWTDRQSRLRCHDCDPPRHPSLVISRQVSSLAGPEPWPRQDSQEPARHEISRWGDLRDDETLEAWWSRLNAGQQVRGSGSLGVFFLGKLDSNSKKRTIRNRGRRSG